MEMNRFRVRTQNFHTRNIRLSGVSSNRQPMKHLPNIITLSRLVFLVIIAFLAFETWGGSATLVFLLCIIASVTDWLDGFIARRCGYVTDIGKLMDAIVDKFLVIGLFCVILFRDMLGNGINWLDTAGWWILFATILRDFVITGMRMIAAKHGVVLAADKMGKRKTIWQSTAICVLFAVPMFLRDFAVFGLPNWFTDFIWINGVLYYFLGGFMAIFSGILYIIRYAPLLSPRAVKIAKGE
jgi:CDP-diacylglycerol---glycerol-3-phosphate 3-phosphatidyltransferase